MNAFKRYIVDVFHLVDIGINLVAIYLICGFIFGYYINKTAILINVVAWILWPHYKYWAEWLGIPGYKPLGRGR